MIFLEDQVDTPFRVLVLDDDALLRRVITDTLTERGHHCFSASTLAEARRVLGEKHVDLALIDIFLPDGDGDEFCREVRDTNQDIVLLLMTARPEPTYEDATNIGDAPPKTWVVDDFFVKTNDLDELWWRIDLHLAQAARIRNRRQREGWLHGLVAMAPFLAVLGEPERILSYVLPMLAQLPQVVGVKIELKPDIVIGTAPPDAPYFETVPIGERGMGTLTLWFSSPKSVDNELLVMLGNLMGSAMVGAQTFSAMTERQARLERGYLERQRQLARLTGRLDRLTEARDSFLALVSHDLRSPISVVLGHCQLLEEGLLNPNQSKKAFETMRRQTERMSRMVEDLLDRYRQGYSGAGEPGQGDLSQILRDMAETFEPVASRRRQKIEVVAPLKVPIEADIASLCEVIANLLENALRHGPESSTVSLVLTTENDQAMIQIQDQGPGFSATPETIGTGLGLRACMRIVAASGGILRTGTMPNALEPNKKGGVVTILLPLPTQARASTRIAIVGSDINRLERMAELVGNSWPCTTYSEPMLALAGLQKDRPAVLILDHSIHDAVALLEQIKNDNELGAIPVIFVVPAGMQNIVEAVRVLGTLAVVQLPLDADELVAMVHKALRFGTESRLGVVGRSLDGLTGLEMPEFLELSLPALQQECRAAGQSLPVVRIHVEDLKGINRNNGWVVGDQLLIWLSSQIRERASPNDLCIRTGGSTFVWVRPGRELQATQDAIEELVASVERARPRLGVSRVTVHIEATLLDAAQAELSHVMAWSGVRPGNTQDRSMV